MLNFFKKKKVDEEVEIPTSNSIETVECPVCKGSVVENENFFICLNVGLEKCHFKCPSTINGAKYDLSLIADFNKFQETEAKFDGVSGVTGQVQDIRSKFNEISPGAVKIKEICRTCSNHLYLHPDKKKVICSKEGCNFQMDTFYNGVDFSINQLEELIQRRISEEYVFNGKIGRVILSEDDKGVLDGKYIFVDDISKLAKKYIKYRYVPSSINTGRGISIECMIQKYTKKRIILK